MNHTVLCKLSKVVHSAVVSPLARELPTRVQILVAASGLPPFE
jgi:hypothetical protein